MKLLSVNVGLPRPVPHDGQVVTTGIFKQPVDGPVMMRLGGLDGDGQADLANHGGQHKAVYAYTHEMYAHWAGELGRDDFTLGQFGENLTVCEMPDDEVCIGDVYRIRAAEVQVTQPRAPCFKLGLRMGDAAFIKRFLQSCRVGFYLRVLEEGEVAAGDDIERITADPRRVSVMDACRLMHFDRANRAAIERVLAVDALSPAWREAYEAIITQDREG